MGRRHTAGVVGYQAVGGVQVDNTSFTAAENLDIVMDPSGTGLFKIAGDAQLQAQGDLRFADADSSNYVALQAPSTVASDVTWTLPNADGTNGQALTTNGSGVLSFASAGLALTDNTTDSGTNYLTFTTSTSGTLSASRVSSTKLTFQPSTGTMDVAGVVRSLRTENVQTGSYTLALTDRNAVVTMNNTGSATVTIPNESSINFPIGSVVYIARVNTGAVTLAASGGVTVSKTGTFGTGEEIYVRKRSSNNWLVVDQISSANVTGGTIMSGGEYNVHTFSAAGSYSLIVS